MLRSDQHRLRHMLDAAREAVSFAHGRSRADLDVDRMLLLSLVKCVEIVSEAAANVSAEARREVPDIPWRDAVRMRNRLIHAYFDINLDRVWETVQSDLPPLIAQLEVALSVDANSA